jgi:hypothetical protein
MTQDGLTATGHGSKAMQIVIDMLTDLCRHPGDGGLADTGAGGDFGRGDLVHLRRLTASRGKGALPPLSLRANSPRHIFTKKKIISTCHRRV